MRNHEFLRILSRLKPYNAQTGQNKHQKDQNKVPWGDAVNGTSREHHIITLKSDIFEYIMHPKHLNCRKNSHQTKSQPRNYGLETECRQRHPSQLTTLFCWVHNFGMPTQNEEVFTRLESLPYHLQCGKTSHQTKSQPRYYGLETECRQRHPSQVTTLYCRVHNFGMPTQNEEVFTRLESLPYHLQCGKTSHQTKSQPRYYGLETECRQRHPSQVTTLYCRVHNFWMPTQNEEVLTLLKSLPYHLQCGKTSHQTKSQPRNYGLETECRQLHPSQLTTLYCRVQNFGMPTLNEEVFTRLKSLR